MAFVLIEDEEFWKGDLKRRIPIRRDYLGSLVRAVNDSNPEVIALDFDFRSPVPDGSLIEHPAYELERQQLLQAIKDAARNTPIVLPKAIEEIANLRYQEQADIFRGFDFSEVSSNIFAGYIEFAPDLRIIPRPLLVRGKELDSFSFAVVHAYSPEMYESLLKEDKELDLRFGSFFGESSFDRVSYRATDVIAGNKDVLRHLRNKIVILGSKWHQNALGVGDWNDQHFTPVGNIIGAYTHGNYVEALRLGRYFPALREGWIIMIEIALVACASLLLALRIPSWIKVMAAIFPSLTMTLLGYFLLQNLGLFFEVFIPTVVIVAHMIGEHLRWRSTD